MPSKESGGGGLPNDDVDNIFTVEASPLPQKDLISSVMVFGPVLKAPVEPAQGVAGYFRGDGPAGEGAGGLLDVVLGVVANAHGEQL